MSKRRRKQSKRVAAPSKEIEQALTNLVAGLLTGQTEKVSVPITLTLPKGLYNTYQAAAKQYGVPVEEFLQEAAEHGIGLALSVGITPGDPVANPIDLAKKEGFNVSGIQEGLTKIQDLAKQMEQLQVLVDDRFNTKNPS